MKCPTELPELTQTFCVLMWRDVKILVFCISCHTYRTISYTLQYVQTSAVFLDSDEVVFWFYERRFVSYCSLLEDVLCAQLHGGLLLHCSEDIMVACTWLCLNACMLVCVFFSQDFDYEMTLQWSISLIFFSHERKFISNILYLQHWHSTNSKWILEEDEKYLFYFDNFFSLFFIYPWLQVPLGGKSKFFTNGKFLNCSVLVVLFLCTEY